MEKIFGLMEAWQGSGGSRTTSFALPKVGAAKRRAEGFKGGREADRLQLAWPKAFLFRRLKPPMKYSIERPFADPEKAAHKLLEIANATEAIQDGRIQIEKLNAHSYSRRGSPAEYQAGLDLALARGWLWRHESGTYVKFTQADADLFS